MDDQKRFPQGMTPLGDVPFTFDCHPGVSCFTVCCRKVDLLLYPYDVLCLKRGLDMDSETFLRSYTTLVRGDNPYFPSVMLTLTDEGRGNCPFLAENGCAIYDDRPSGCRTYPLERAVDRRGQVGRRDHYFLVRHEYCKGHDQKKSVTVQQYIRSQHLERYNLYNELWAEVDSIFRTNPWQGEGQGGARQQLAFMACYNIDGFRRMVEERELLRQFALTKQRRRDIERLDEELLKFGFDWLKLLLTNQQGWTR
ncbi:MAG: YkgJ family cysteine cluster protein [Desulfopila sp.]